MGSSKKVVSGVAWSIIVNVVNAIYGFISVPILIRYFGKAEYGLIGLATSVNVYIQLMDLGFSSTNVRFFSVWLTKGLKEKVKKLFQTSLAFYGTIGIINALILLVVLAFSNSIFNVTPEQDQILKSLLAVLTVAAILNWVSSCFDQLVSATENVAWIKRRALIPKLLMIAILFGTVYFKLSILTYFILSTVSTFIELPLTINKIRKEAPYVSFLPKLDKETFKEILPYCLNIFSFGLFQFSFFNLRPVFLGIQGTPEAVADYRVLNGIASLVTMVGGVFMGALLPSSSKIVAQGNKDAYYRIAYQGTKYVSILYCFCSFGLMAIGSDLMTLYVGESYLYLLPWLNAWLFFTLGGHNKCISSLILSGADIRAITYMSAFSSIFGLVVCWFTIPSCQVGGTVIGLGVYIVCQALFFYTYYWPRKMGINSLRVLTNSFGPYVLLGAACYYLCKYLPHLSNHWGNVVYLGIVFSVVFLTVSYFTTDKEDKSFFMSLLKR